MSVKEDEACREAVLSALLEVLNGLAMTKSMTVGRPRSSPGAVGARKMRASAGRYLVPNNGLSAFQLEYFPWKSRPVGDASRLRQRMMRPERKSGERCRKRVSG